jgi:hypothetical protein
MAATCVALITTRLNTSPTVSLIGAALAAAVPVLINTGSPRAIFLGIGATAVALGLTYVGFTAADPNTFPGSRDLREKIAPPNTVTTPTETQAMILVPDVVGKPYAEAKVAVEASDLNADRKDVELAEYAQGVVVEQDPDAGASVEKGSTVELSVTPVAVLNFIGKSADDAREGLAVFSLVETTQDVSDPTQDGVVIDQSPVDTMAAPGTTVELTIGRNPTP